MVEPQTLIDAIEDAGFEARSYSGRGMYGKECVGVDLDATSDLWGLAQEMARSGIICDQPRTDSMGLGIIAYWPRLSWPENA